jgi:hypothetical protein
MSIDLKTTTKRHADVVKMLMMMVVMMFRSLFRFLPCSCSCSWDDVRE